VCAVGAHCLLQEFQADGADAFLLAVLMQRDHGLHPTPPTSPLGLLKVWHSTAPDEKVQPEAALEQPRGQDSGSNFRQFPLSIKRTKAWITQTTILHEFQKHLISFGVHPLVSLYLLNLKFLYFSYTWRKQVIPKPIQFSFCGFSVNIFIVPS
jgi:hypothetical protein